MKALPKQVAGGPQVSDLAYRIVIRALTADADRDGSPAHLARIFDVDEADVLRALAELVQKGVIVRGARG